MAPTAGMEPLPWESDMGVFDESISSIFSEVEDEPEIDVLTLSDDEHEEKVCSAGSRVSHGGSLSR